MPQRTNYDIEMLQEIGFCKGIENYSRVLTGRAPGSTPYTLLDYFPEDFLIFIDESHVTLPQAPRHVRRRPQPQGSPRRVWVPAALGAG